MLCVDNERRGSLTNSASTSAFNAIKNACFEIALNHLPALLAFTSAITEVLNR